MSAMITTYQKLPTHKPVNLAKRDQRTKEARLMRETHSELVRHVGGKPSATQTMMIERAVQLTLRIADMDRKFADTGAMSDFASRTYLAWSNSLTRTLAKLGVAGATAEKPPSLQDYISTAPRRVRAPSADLAGDEAPEPPEPANDALAAAAGK